MTGILGKPKALLIAILIVSVLVISVIGGALGEALGLGFLASSLLAIQLPAEMIFEGDDFATPLGAWNLMNTMLTTWLAMLVLIILALFIRKSLTEVPGRFQALFEIIIEFFLNLCESIAGREKGRRFFPLVFTIFIFIVVANWMGILPGFGTVGRIADPEEIAHHHGIHHYVDPALGDHISEDSHAKHDGHADDSHAKHDGHADDSHAKHDGHADDSHAKHDEHADHLDSVALHVFTGQGAFSYLAPGSFSEQLTFEEYENQKGLVGEDKRAGHLVPFLRSANTDINMTLAMAIIAMVMVHFWGFSILGFPSHIGKFINFKEGPIGFFVGILEIISELAKVVSFTFRLFGNIFAGEVLLMALAFLLPLIGIIPFLGLELFVGVIQAFIFSMLTLVFASMASVSHSSDDHH